MVRRLAKNRYAWHGRHNLTKTLQTLKKVGEENKYTQQIQMIKKREYEHEFDLDGERNEEMQRSFVSNENSEMCFVELPGMEFRAGNISLQCQEEYVLMIISICAHRKKKKHLLVFFSKTLLPEKHHICSWLEEVLYFLLVVLFDSYTCFTFRGQEQGGNNR